MKIFFIFFIILIFSKYLYSNENLVGKWQVKNVPDNCEMKYESSSTHRGSGIDGKFLQIKKDRTIQFIVRSRTNERYEYIFIGKINPSWKKIGMNDNWGDFNITGKVKNNKIFAKLNALNEQHKDYYKRKAKNCTFEFHKIDTVQKESSKNQASENLENEEQIQRNTTKTKQFLREEGFARSEILRLEEMINSDYLFANLISSKICLQRNGMITFVSKEGGCGFGEEINLDQLKKIFRNDNDITQKNNDMYLSIDTILGEWEGTGRYQSDEYPVYVIFDLNSRGELVGRYNYGTKNNHEKGGTLSLLIDDINKNWKEILKLQRRFAMEWNEGDDNGWFSFEVKGNEQILGFWGYNMKTKADFGGSYSITKISNNIPKLADSENSNTIEPISPPNF